MQNFIKNNKIISHIGAHYIGNYTGYHLASYLSRGDKFIRIVNGYLVGLGTGFVFNMGLYLYTRQLEAGDIELKDREKNNLESGGLESLTSEARLDDHKDKEMSTEVSRYVRSETTLDDDEECEAALINAFLEYYCK
jgi:hypothetical protein